MERNLLKTSLGLTGVFLMLVLSTAKTEAKTLISDFLKEKDIDVGVSASVDYYNKYVWRGFLLDGDPVMQPSVTLSVGGFKGGFWGSFDMENKDELASDETDGWISYTSDLGFLKDELKFISLTAGHTWYGFPETHLYSKEFFFGIALDTFLSPYLTWYLDYEDEEHGGADGNYFMLGGSHSFILNKKYGVALTIGQELGYNSEAFINGEGFYSLTKATLAVPLTENATLSPVIAYSAPFDALADAQKEQLYTGVSLSMSF